MSLVVDVELITLQIHVSVIWGSGHWKRSTRKSEEVNSKLEFQNDPERF